ncbi:MAG: hypothetical protein AAF530_22540 [Pseudomonadota bacterium]
MPAGPIPISSQARSDQALIGCDGLTGENAASVFISSQRRENEWLISLELYGIITFTHGWAKVLTVMSPRGATAVRAHIEPGPDLFILNREGQLTQYQEKRKGAILALAQFYGIKILERPDWAEKKAELGEKILC